METGQTTHCGNKKTLIVYFFSKCYLNQKIKLMLYLRSQYNSNRSHELIRKIFIWIQKQVYFRQSFRTNRINFAAKRVALCWPLEWSQVNVLASLFWPTSNIHILYIVCGHKLPVWYIFFLHVSVPQITKKTVLIVAKNQPVCQPLVCGGNDTNNSNNRVFQSICNCAKIC